MVKRQRYRVFVWVDIDGGFPTSVCVLAPRPFDAWHKVLARLEKQYGENTVNLVGVVAGWKSVLY